MVAPTKSRKRSFFAPPVADLLAALRQEFAEAEVARGRRFVAQIAPDRAIARPGVAVAQLRVGRDDVVLEAGELFCATHDSGPIDFLSTRREAIPSVIAESSEPFDEPREVIAGRPERAGLRVVVSRL